MNERDPNSSSASRRDFLSGKALHGEVRSVGDVIADSIIGHTKASPPIAGDTLRLTTRAMACDFSVIMNGGEHDNVWDASAALDLLHTLEEQLSVYREHSEVSILNRTAHAQPAVVEPQLFELLQVAKELHAQTSGAFDLTTDPLIQLWAQCRAASRTPSDDEVFERLESVGMQFVRLDSNTLTLQFDRSGMSINLGAIGKGYALDRAAKLLSDEGLDAMLLHGGHSSLLACGSHNDIDGWPVGIGNPLFTNQRLGTIVLRDQAMATSGSNIQYFRVAGKRYGHILDPRTGWPVEETLSVTAVADSAAVADALSTAFYVAGEAATIAYCESHPDVGAIIIPQPTRDKRIHPRVCNIDLQRLYWEGDQIIASEATAPTTE